MHLPKGDVREGHEQLGCPKNIRTEKGETVVDLEVRRDGIISMSADQAQPYIATGTLSPRNAQERALTPPPPPEENQFE
jgi:hypothetical protein